jgi:hypothetical protein
MDPAGRKRHTPVSHLVVSDHDSLLYPPSSKKIGGIFETLREGLSARRPLGQVAIEIVLCEARFPKNHSSRGASTAALVVI